MASPAASQPGVGGGGVDVVPGSDGGMNVVVQGSYTEVPTGTVTQSGGASSSSPGASSGSAPSAPSGPTLQYSETEDPAITRVETEGGDLQAFTAIDEDGSTWECGVENPGQCVQLSPDVGVPATPPIVDVATVVQQAVTGLQLEPPPVCMTPANGEPPPPGNVGLVGLWSWMWICSDQIRPSTVGPQTSVASVGAVTVTATAHHTSILANWGTGALPVVCPGGPQVPYSDVFLDFPSPTGCSHHLEKSSELEPGGVFRPSFTSNWLVYWTATTPAGTQGGVIPILLTSRTEIRVGEMQVLVTN